MMPTNHTLPSRHELRIARIHMLSRETGRPLSLEYLQSCDLRALPVLQDALEAGKLGRRLPRWWPFGA